MDLKEDGGSLFVGLKSGWKFFVRVNQTLSSSSKTLLPLEISSSLN